ncbi:hypothetical protein Aspvir_009826 [Aspergillus viridinutans]|uniref:C2H2-type domain-containing protein n=1 Tax=Aspergillus viridinutans TaxID=75553 RepID=A0A9P3F8R5_ASPVI|nr:uncharacterized protein Aspvir_009826 [Aspergillus viridinutans]GIK05713.1 hypothetical protein Aspvir_009826 [Aspergillus viridinutans]
MNWTSESFSSASAYVPSSSDDNSMMIEPTHGYATEAFARANYPRSSQPPTGLGITYVGMEAQFSQMGLCSAPETLSQPTTDWPDQLMPSVFESCLEIENLTAGACYESFPVHHDVSASPHSLYSPQTLSASPSYCSTLDVGNQDTTCSQPSHRWPGTPCSDNTTPFEGWSHVKQEYDDCPDPLLYSEPSDAPGVCTSRAIPQLMVNDTFAVTASPEKEEGDTALKPDLISEDAVGHGQTATMPQLTAQAGTTTSNHIDSCKVPSANGLVCTVCGTRFTRRSNCREHMKRHDPNCRKLYPCEACGKTFGRRTDLKRHVDSIHHGLRKFGCDQCGRRFSRQDTLARQVCTLCPIFKPAQF